MVRVTGQIFSPIRGFTSWLALNPLYFLEAVVSPLAITLLSLALLWRNAQVREAGSKHPRLHRPESLTGR